jgi:hypothetical protein
MQSNTSRGRSGIILAGALALSLGMGACGAGGVGSAAPSVGTSIPAKDLADKVSKAMEEAGTAKFTGTNDGASIKGELDARNKSMHVTGSSESGPIDSIIIDGVMYFGGEGVSFMTGGKKYAKIDPKADDPMSKMMAPMLNQTRELTNPSSIFLAVPGLTSTVTGVKDGAVTYTTKLTGEQVWAMVEGGSGGGVKPTATPNAEQLAGMSAELVQTLDAKDRPQSIVVTTTTAGKSRKQTFDYTDWGAPVAIKAPPASEVGVATMPSAG